MEKIKLSACPFCGSEDIEFTNLEGTGPERDYGLAVICSSCGGAIVTGFPLENTGMFEARAADMWNKRVKRGLFAVIKKKMCIK